MLHRSADCPNKPLLGIGYTYYNTEFDDVALLTEHCVPLVRYTVVTVL